MVKNIYGYSWWAIAAVVLNWPWIAITVLVTYFVTTAPGIVAGEIWLGPMIVWGFSAPAVAISCAIALSLMIRYPDRVRGRAIVCFALAVLVSGPSIALIYCGLTGRL